MRHWHPQKYFQRKKYFRGELKIDDTGTNEGAEKKTELLKVLMF